MVNRSILSPVFYERTKDGETFYDIQSRLIKDRVIFLSEPVTKEAAGIISSLLFMMNNENKEEKISIWLNTPGGDAYAFLAIYDMMQMIQAPVETVCIGMAMSAGALLMAAGSKGRRFATPNSKFMIHQMQLSLMPGGTATEIAVEAENIATMNRDIVEILARHTGQTYEKVLADCEHDTYLTAKQAKEYGIVDKIIGLSKEIPPLLTEKSVAKKSPAKKAPAKRPAKKATKKTV